MKSMYATAMKKIKKIKVLLSLVLSLCILCVSAYAAVIDSAIYNTNTNTVTVKGNVQTSGNIISDPGCTDASKWSKASSGTLSADSDGIKLTERKNYYDGIRQDVYSQVSYYKNGKYRLSGEIKALGDKTVTTDTKGNGDSVAPVTFTSGTFYVGIFVNTATKSFPVSNVGNDWVAFSGNIEISNVTEFIEGKNFINIVSSTVDAKDENGTVLVGPDNKNRKVGDTRDFCIRNMSLEYVAGDSLYQGAEKIGISVCDGENNTVYVNERHTDESGNYAISMKLPEGTDTDNLTVKIKGKNQVVPVSKEITKTAVNEQLVLSSAGGKTRVMFDIFDFFDSANFSDVTAIVASYDPVYDSDGNIDGYRLYDASKVEIGITEDSEPTQYVDVNPPRGSGFIKLFLLTDEIVPVCEVHQSGMDRKLFLVGDSICTAYKNANQYPGAGWGQYIGNYLDDNITVVNCAHGGYSTASFMVSDTYRGAYGGAHSWNSETIVGKDGKTRATNPILPQINAGDYVMISLGINDNASSPIGTTVEEYRTFLTQMANDTRAKGADVIFVTPTITAATPYKLAVPERVEIMKEVANDTGAVCLELGARLVEIYNNTDRDTVEKYHMYRKWLKESKENGGFGLTDEEIANHSNSNVRKGNDTLHLSYLGADLVAKTISELLTTTTVRGNLSPLAGFVKNN